MNGNGSGFDGGIYRSQFDSRNERAQVDDRKAHVAPYLQPLLGAPPVHQNTGSSAVLELEHTLNSVKASLSQLRLKQEQAIGFRSSYPPVISPASISVTSGDGSDNALVVGPTSAFVHNAGRPTISLHSPVEFVESSTPEYTKHESFSTQASNQSNGSHGTLPSPSMARSSLFVARSKPGHSEPPDSQRGAGAPGKQSLPISCADTTEKRTTFQLPSGNVVARTRETGKCSDDCSGAKSSVNVPSLEHSARKSDRCSGKSNRSFDHMGRCSMEAYDIVQMSSPMYFVEENERKLQVDIMRMGSLRGSCRVRYHTEDGTAEAGVRYRAQSSEVRFRDGEHLKTITLQVLDGDTWAAMLEFKIILTDPENCELGLYLYHARVKIIDKDVFPSSRYAEKIEQGTKGIDSIAGLGLFWEYCKLHLHGEGIWWRTVTILICDQLHNIYFLVTLLLNIYMVDVLFKNDEETDKMLWFSSGPGNGRAHTAYAIGLLWIAPMAVLHYWDYKKIRLDLDGLSQKFLQLNLFRKYLNYSESSRLKTPAASMQVAITTETNEVVAGYMGMLSLFQIASRLIISVIFILRENPSALASVVLMPIMMLLFCFARANLGVKAIEKVALQTSRVLHMVNEAVTKYTLISDYKQRPHMCDLFQKESDLLFESKIPVEVFRLFNNYFPKWLGPVFTGIYVATQANAVCTGELSVGRFLATIKVFSDLSEEFTEGYKQLMKIASAFVPLRKLTHLFNLETDLLFWKTINRKRRELSKMACLEALEGSRLDDAQKRDEEALMAFRTDRIDLKLRGVNFSYRQGRLVLQGVNLSCEQGKLVAVVGPHGGGKTTLLRLLGHVIFPTDGTVFIPTHLRILHVEQQAMLLDLSVWKNVTFGRPDAPIDLVRSVLQQLNMHHALELMEKELAADAANSDSMSSLIFGRQFSNESTQQSTFDSDDESSESLQEEDDDSVPWQEKLSSSEKAKIHLTRALIMNPEVLVVHRPDMNYDAATSETIIDALRSFVSNRGFQLPSETRFRRRPRTCFFTPTTFDQATKSDIVWLVENCGVVPSVSKDEMRRRSCTFELDEPA